MEATPVAGAAVSAAAHDCRENGLAVTIAVSARSLGKTIDEKRILHDISLDIPVGCFLSLLGANGAGKSTLLKILAKLQTPSRGELSLFGEPMRYESAGLRARLGLIGHNSMLYRDLTLLENLLFYGRLYGLSSPRKRAIELLEHVGLSHRQHDQAKTLSRGMAQRLSIARALMHDPQLILADEPFAGLDAPSAATVERLLRSLHEQGRTIVLAGHDLPQSLSLSERVVVLRAGVVVLDAPADALDAATVLAEIART